MGNYFPTTDVGLLGFANNLNTKVQAATDHYGLDAAWATKLGEDTLAFITAMAAVADKANRTQAAIAAKNTVREELIPTVRKVVQAIQKNPVTTNEDREELWLPIAKTRSTIPPPTVAPTVDITLVRGRQVSLRLHDGERTRPSQASEARIYTFIGEAAPGDPTLWTLSQVTQLARTTVSFDASVPAGAQVWFIACWTNPRHEPGPLSSAVTTNLQYGIGSMSPAALRLRDAA